MSAIFSVLSLLAVAVCSAMLAHIGGLTATRADGGRYIATALVGAPYLVAVLLACAAAQARGGWAAAWPAGGPGWRATLCIVAALCAAAVAVVATGMLPGAQEAASAIAARRFIGLALPALLFAALLLGMFPTLAGSALASVLRGGWALLVLATLGSALVLVQQAQAATAARVAAQAREIPGVTAPAARVWQRVDGHWTYDGQRFQAADPGSLQPLDGDFARDAVQGYYHGAPVPGSHGPSFEVLGRNEARDRQAVYWADTHRRAQDFYLVQHVQIETITDADPARYEVLRHGYGRDGRRAWRRGQRLRSVGDAASFEVLAPGVTRDARRGQFEDIEIPGSEGASFALVDPADPAWVRDRRHAWHLRTHEQERGGALKHDILPLQHADPAALSPLGEGYASDGRRVWWRGVPVPDADAASFTAGRAAAGQGAQGTSPPDAHDVRGPFRNGRRVQASPAD